MNQTLNPAVERTANQLLEASKTLTPLVKIFETLKTDLKDRTGQIKFKTGIDSLDYILWGLHKRELLVYGARTSQGKSCFAVNCARTLSDCNQSVLYLSLEMSKEQLLERILSSVCDIDSNLLRTGKALQLVAEREKSFMSWIDRVPLTIDDTNGHHFDKIIDIVKLTSPDFVIVDYIQMISTKGFKDKLSAMEDFVKEIHLLGKKRNFGTILISQINRQGVGRPYLENLKGCGFLEEHPDTVILAQWDWEKQEYIMWVEKQRHGITGKLEVRFEPQFSRFSNEEIPNVDNIKRKDWIG